MSCVRPHRNRRAIEIGGPVYQFCASAGPVRHGIDASRAGTRRFLGGKVDMSTVTSSASAILGRRECLCLSNRRRGVPGPDVSAARHGGRPSDHLRERRLVPIEPSGPRLHTFLLASGLSLEKGRPQPAAAFLLHKASPFEFQHSTSLLEEWRWQNRSATQRLPRPSPGT